ncbi:MAG: hypothetical protein Q4G68_03745 [Planctomycetia bacterium]|nr:hypothetical protein [Planctomycetia bacterium]
MNGKPVPNVAVSFNPVDGNRQSIGATDAQGRFVMKYTNKLNGVERGEHKVAILPFPPMEDMPVTDPTVIEQLKKYSEEDTKLVFKITKTDKNFVINLE